MAINSRGGAGVDLLWLLGILIALGFVWVAVGRPTGFGNSKGLFLPGLPTPRVPDQTIVSSEIHSESDEPGSSSGSVWHNKITLRRGGATATELDKEYLEITADRRNTGPVNISAWRLKGSNNLDLPIGQAVKVFYSGQQSFPENILLPPRGRVIVTTGRSPVGSSFQTNKCTGYLNQTNFFRPSLTEHCPSPKDEDIVTSSSGLGDRCLDFIDSLPRCEYYDQPLPIYLSNSCHEFVSRNFNYNGCLDLHRTDQDFFEPEWRVFLNRSEELWKAKREKIILYDERGKIVAELAY